MKPHEFVKLATVVGMVLTLTACAPEGGAPLDGSAYPYEVEFDELTTSIMEDDAVTAAEYRSAADANLACIGAIGAYEMRGPVLDPVDQLRWAYDGVPGPGITDDKQSAAQRCEARFYTIEGAYLSTHDAVMAPPLLAAALECADEGGLRLSESAVNWAELTAGLSEPEVSVARECVTDLVFKMYPDVPTVKL